MDVGDVIGAAKGAVNKTGAGDVFDVPRQKFDTVGVDPEVGNEAGVFFVAIRALLFVVPVGGRGASLLNHEVFALVFQVVDPLLHGFNSVVGGGDGDLLCPKGFIVGGKKELMRWVDLSALSMAASAIFFTKRSATSGESSDPWALRAA